MNTRARLLLASVALLFAAGCASQRSLQYVRNSGDHAYQLGQYQVALKEYTEVVDRDPSDWRYRVALGKTLLVLNRPVPAREQLAVAFNMKPSDTETMELLAQAMAESGDKDGMFKLLRSRAQEKKTVDDYLRLGAFAAQAGDIDEAERALLTAARLDGGKSVDVQMALAGFYAKVGADDKALRRLRMALYLDPSNKKIQDRIRAMGQIPGPSYALQPDDGGQ